MNNPLEAPGIVVLENQPIDPRGKYQYKAILVRKHSDTEKSWERGYDGHWILKIVGLYDNGPSVTPGQWYLDTLLGYDNYGSKVGDFIYIDQGQQWGVKNMLAVTKEAEEIAYGKMDESLNEGAVKDLMTKGPEKEAFLEWANELMLSTSEPSEIIRMYCQENQITPSELQILATLHMEAEDGDPNEMEVLSYVVSCIVEGKMTGELDEAEEIRYSYGTYAPRDTRNWYQKPENLVGYKEPQPIQLKRRKKKTPKVFSQMLELEAEINDLEQEIKDLSRGNRDMEAEREEFMGWIQSEYDWKVLDILASGSSDEDKIQSLEQWNMEQDTKDKSIPNPKNLVFEYKGYYPDDEKDVDQEISDIEEKIKEKSKELSDMQDIYESLNEGISSRINFKRFEEEILKPLADQMEVEFKVGKVSQVASIGKKIMERYYALGHLTILVRDIKRIGMPGEDIEPWIVDPKKPTKGLRFGSDWGSYKEFKDKVRELLTSAE